MERFVGLIVGGGIAVVAGLWTGAVSNPWTLPWVCGGAVATVGGVGLLVGILSEVEYRSAVETDDGS